MPISLPRAAGDGGPSPNSTGSAQARWSAVRLWCAVTTMVRSYAAMAVGAFLASDCHQQERRTTSQFREADSPAARKPASLFASGAVQPQSAACADGMGWDGSRCASTECGEGAAFRIGSGCISCIGECDGQPESSERAPWGNSAASFDRPGALAALAKVDISACLGQGSISGASAVEVTFSPSGAPAHVAINDERLTGTRLACAKKSFGTVRVAAFGGFPVTVVHVFRY